MKSVSRLHNGTITSAISKLRTFGTRKEGVFRRSSRLNLGNCSMDGQWGAGENPE